MRSSRVTVSVLAIFAVGLLSTSAMARHLSPLPSRHGWDANAKHYTAPGGVGGTWQGLANAFPGSGFPDTAQVMTDGTVMMHDGCTTDWYKLTPDNTGSYHNGTWSKAASMPSGDSPLYFSSAVLPDGKFIVEGGEYINCNAVWTNKGAIYDPVANTWTNVTPPSGWANIGDAQSVVLNSGTYYQADALNTASAYAAVSGTTVTWTTPTTGKADRYDEEGWTTLPDNRIITVDANRDLTGAGNDVEFFNPTTLTWTTASEKTPVLLVDSGSHELGPAPLLPNGLVYQIGATAHNAIYDNSTGHWTAGPDTLNIGGQLQSADGPAVVMPNGTILEQVSPGVFNAPSHFVEVTVNADKTVSQVQVSEPSSAASQSSYEGRLAVLPTGQVLWSSDVGDVQIYTPSTLKGAKGSIPKIKSGKTSLTVGSKNNKFSGLGFNGKTFGGYYGDDAQMATNFPLVRFTNNSSHHVCYARTHNFSKMGIDDGTKTAAKFDIPASCETGASTMEAVVNGIPSKGKAVTLN
ncbi:MAG: hypothetical protein JOZ72_05640 [Alphaproteobacteria bacterium]|nr:hypothetical protein [Alphaproteobacteria bacterium]